MACRVDFYVQAAEAPKGHLTLACRETEKAYQAGHRITCDARMHNRPLLDELLDIFAEQFCAAPVGFFRPVRCTRYHRAYAPEFEQAEVIVSLAEEPIPDVDGFARVARLWGTTAHGANREENGSGFIVNKGLIPSRMRSGYNGASTQ